ncbi:MAG: hypothetical protein Unbinned2072contig1001_1 [Prokaryotic dsDNA virus sp.]|nr:MAG: hypothetical protein Unbinned2072contig1001_1 [Prokaryotic dsDNA virus sp.]|tara:strand:- start:14651 stop:14908 length:258 start_codon:yes stop_codon:yes gene_type:complete
MSNTYEHKEGTGSLFKNDKEPDSKQPDYKGKAKVDGKMKDLSAWLNTSKDGKTKYLSLSIQEPYSAPSDGVKVTKVAQADDDLPF